MLIVKGKIVGSETIPVEFYDKEGKKQNFNRKSVFIVDGGRPQEVRVDEKDDYPNGKDVEISVYVKAWASKAGNAGFRLVKQRQ